MDTIVQMLPAELAAQAAAHPAVATAAVGVAAFLALALMVKFCTSLGGVNASITKTAEKSNLYHDLQTASDVDARKAHAQDMTNAYYDLSTDLYVTGWGESFHFAPRFKHETFAQSLVRHEYQLGARLGLQPGQLALDVGCGVGGPARNIARFTGCKVVGLNNNAYQISRGTAMNVRDGLDGRIRFVKGDFMAMPFAEGSFDAAYAVEATCHAPDRVGVYREVFKALKPGGVFGSYEWVTTDKYDAGNAEHRAIKKGIEVGDSLPDLVSAKEVEDALRAAGFIVEEVTDLALDTEVAWTAPFVPSYTISGFRTTPLGLFCTDALIHVLETLRLAPRGTGQMHRHLITATKNLSAGERTGIFTPMLFVKARKPGNAERAAAGSDASSAEVAPGRRNSGTGAQARRR